MTAHARVVIVGGGILGCSLAYHLAREGWPDCVLIEKGELTSGSTWHAAGQVTHSTSSYGLGRMAGYAIDLYQRIEAETGQSVTFHDCGSLRIAYSEDELDWLRYTMSIGAALGHPMEILGPAAIRALHPFYHVDATGADCLGGEAILVDGERTGAVSSGAWGPSVDASLAFGYVRPEHAAPGTELDVLVLGEPRAARVLAEARYDPGKLRPRG